MNISDEGLMLLAADPTFYHACVNGEPIKDMIHDLIDARKELAGIKAKSIEIGEGDKVLEYDVPAGVNRCAQPECGFALFGVGCRFALDKGPNANNRLPGPDCPQNGKIIVILKRSK
jgi:hypothetical protein